MAKGTTEVDFGASPGEVIASVVVSGQANILAGSIVEAWVHPVATADNSVDNHKVVSLDCFCPPEDIVGGASFKIWVYSPTGPVTGRFTIAWAGDWA